MKAKRRKILLGVVVVVVAAIVGIYFFLKYQTYDYIEIKNTYENTNTDNTSYKYCMEGVLRYSRDGIALLTQEGEELWNQSCQMSNPTVEMCGESVAVADKGGTSILVFQKKGLKGEFKTTRPIEKFAVSSQGVVAVILEDEEVPMVICYDATGNILIEHKVSLNTMGYPVDVALSEKGNTLLVSYLNTHGNHILSKIAYYYFGNDGKAEEDYLVKESEFENSIVPTTAFLNGDTSLLVADNALYFYEGLIEPKETTKIEIKQEIQSVSYNENLVALFLKNEGGAGYRLNLYNVRGKALASVDVENEYTEIRVVKDRIILFDGQVCSIYMKNGVHKYEGNVDENIMEIFPILGLNKYMMINASGFYEVKLVK